MKLSVPNYLKASGCQDSVVHFAWDDWKDLPELESPDRELIIRLKSVSQRAVLAFACGAAEWMIYRFERLHDSTPPWNMIQAAWAMIVHFRYFVGAEAWSYRSQKGWEGPIKGPIKKSLEYLEAAFYLLSSEYREPSFLAAKISTLTSYVMSDPIPYKSWCEEVLNRFEALYPRNPEDQLGDVIPRQAIDPEFDFKVAQTEALINGFLSSLEYHANTFLRSPKAMLEHFEGEENFKGTPYVFSIEEDREVRQESKRHRHD